MDSFRKLLSGMIPGKPLGRLEPENNNGLGVSTIDSTDMGYETAILDDGNPDGERALPVERYKSEEAAIEGHAKWCEFVKDGKGKVITRLGYEDMVDTKEITLIGSEV